MQSRRVLAAEKHAARDDLRILFVGQPHQAEAYAFLRSGHSDLRCAPASALAGPVLETFRPHAIATPLISDFHDCFDVATALSAAEFSGSLLVLATDIPSPALILKEITTRFPSLSIEIVPV